MSWWVWLIVGVVLSGPVWIALSVLGARRLWRTTRRLAARAKGREQLVELAQLAGGLAHEIKNPLSTINVNLKLLSEDLARFDDETHRRWLRRLEGVQAETRRLKDILDDFLHYTGHYELSLKSMDFRTVIDEITDFFLPQAEAAKVVLRSSLSDETLPCRVDVKLIKQALLNLMINAIQAMSEGGELLIRASLSRGRVQVEVIDTGGGMDSEALAKIFQVYYSTKTGGSGLGLPTTRRIIHEHGGTIRAESEPGKGTRFVITLPMDSSR